MKKTLSEDALILKVGRFARLFVHTVPFRLSINIARWIGRGIYYTHKRRHIAYRNLRAVFAGQKSRAEMKAIARRSMENLAMCMAELLRLPDFTKEYAHDNFSLQGAEKIDTALKEGKGAIFLSAHFGNWELSMGIGSFFGYNFTGLAREQKHPRSNEFLNALRISQGGQVIQKGMPIRELLRALKQGKIVAMMSDQDGGKTGTFVKFFGRLSSSPKGVATFAARTGAPVFPVFIIRENGGLKHRVVVEEPIRVPDLTLSDEEIEKQVLQQYSKVLEEKIHQSPDQWLWAHRRWKSTPDRFVLVLSDKKAGHLNQSLAVVEAIRRERRTKGIAEEQLHLNTLEIEFKSPVRKKILDILCVITQGHLPFKPFLLRYVLSDACYQKVMATYADIVISTGSSLLGANLLVSDENRARSAVVMKPFFSADRFDAVIVPKHDKIKHSENVFVTPTALSAMSPEDLQSQARKISEKFGISGAKEKIGVLIGGDTDRLFFDRSLLGGWLGDLESLAGNSGAQILLTTSRRTPSWADQLVKETLEKKSWCPFLVIANEANYPGSVAGIMGLSDRLMVSGESMSMISEAVLSGKPVTVFLPFKKTALKPKHLEFLERLEKQGAISIAVSDKRNQSMSHVLLTQTEEALSQAVLRLI